ncbi:Y-family DNA polymerase [Pacificimonas sp. ICDLI1SI03]
MTRRRIVSIFIPHLAMDRWMRKSGGDWPQDRPLVLAAEGTHGPVIHDVNPAAAALGMVRGGRITDMRALAPDLAVEDADPDANTADLARLAGWAQRWCPWTQRDGADALLLDTTGSAHLHGGEASMLGDMARMFAGAGLNIHLAAAPTVGAAWALSHSGGAHTICHADQLADMLAPLPVGTLRLDAETVQLLQRLGLKTIGALAAVPRAALVRRFRKVEQPCRNPVTRLDQAMGRRAEPLVPAQLRPPLRSIRRLAEPLGDLAGLMRILQDLTGDLSALMDENHIGARSLRFTAFRVDGRALNAEVATSRASRDAAHIIRLFDGKLERLDPGFGVDGAALEVLRAEPLGAIQDDLSGEGRDQMAFVALIDRLSARLGEDAVLQSVTRGSHVPERGEAFLAAAATPHPDARSVNRQGRAPLRLLNTPERAEVIHAVPEGPPARFRWRRQLHDVTRAQGPERIAPEWWCEPGRTRLRDYYRVEDREGRRFWLYREGLASDDRGGTPLWFVHGLDA